ncbi:MAG: acyltransferase family protein [Hyphomonadaceae bacterium]|nr:acyltransferase family protein [Hyphomonadaceae bacterium]
MSGMVGERYHALDAVRGFALVLGVFFHATLAYLPGPQLWVAVDTSRSVELSVVFFILHIFRMTLFFVIAGFFARLLLERRGTWGFIKNRAARIAMPLAMFWPIVITGIVAVAIWAAVQANGGQPLEGEPPPPPNAQTFPLTHLWFLYVLLFFYAAALLLRGLVRLIDGKGVLRARVVDPIVRFITGPIAPLVLAIPMGVAMFLTPNWYAWFGVPTPDTGLVPNTTALICYGFAFGLGWLIHRQPNIFEGWGKWWLAYVGPAVGATIGALMMLGFTPNLEGPAVQDWRTAGYTALYSFACWAWTIVIIGFAVRHLAGHSPARRYLADASYWIYIVHIPIVMALHALFAPYAWPWFVKYPLVLAIAFAVMLVSYQFLVRYSFIGAILNGKREKPPKRAQGEAVLAAAE